MDNTHSSKLAEALRVLGENVMHLQDRFPDNTVDEVWIPAVGHDGLAVVTGDRAIWNDTEKRELLRTHRVSTFFFPKRYPRMGTWDQVAFTVKVWPAVRAEAARIRTWSCFDVHENGKLSSLAA